jgi:hypothetical protein
MDDFHVGDLPFLVFQSTFETSMFILLIETYAITFLIETGVTAYACALDRVCSGLLLVGKVKLLIF